MTETIVNTATTSATVDDVWAVLADYFALASWSTTIDHSSAFTPTPPGPGACRRIQLRGNVFLERVTEWQPGESLAYTIEGLPPVVSSVVNRWTLEGSPDGHTTVTLTGTIEPGPKPAHRVAAKTVARTLNKAGASLVTDLIARAETSAVPPTAKESS